MTTPESFVQKWLLEIRFEVRPGMTAYGGSLVDRWINKECEIEINAQAARFRMTDKSKSLIITTSYTQAVLEVEGLSSLPEFSKIAQRFAKDVTEVVYNFKLERIGLRYWSLIPDILRQEANKKITSKFFTHEWENKSGRDAVTDLMITLEFMSNPSSQGRINFGPYVPETNAPLFVFRDQAKIKDIKDGFLFDCDLGENTNRSSLLRGSELSNWIVDSYLLSQSREKSIQASLFLEDL